MLAVKEREGLLRQSYAALLQLAFDYTKYACTRQRSNVYVHFALHIHLWHRLLTSYVQLRPVVYSHRVRAGHGHGMRIDRSIGWLFNYYAPDQL